LPTLTTTTNVGTLISIPPSQLMAGDNPRTTRNAEKFAALRASVKVNGVLDPIRAYPGESENAYIIESGHGRWEAALAEELELVPVIVVAQDAKAVTVHALVTNIQREDLNSIDEARAYKDFMSEHGYTVAGVAEAVGVTAARVTGRLDLLAMPEAIVVLYAEDRIGLQTRKALKEMAAKSAALAEAVADHCAGKKDWEGALQERPGDVAWEVAAIEQENATTRKPPRFAQLHRNVRLVNASWEGGRCEVKPTAGKLSKKHATRMTELWLEAREARVYGPFDLSDEAIQLAVGSGVTYDAGADRAILVHMDFLSEIHAALIRSCEDKIERAKERATAAKTRTISMGDDGNDSQSEKAAAAAAEVSEFRRQHRQAVEKGRRAAHDANQELGAVIQTKLAKVDVGSLPLPAAKVIAYGLVGPTRADLFQRGLRLCLPQYTSMEKVGAGGKREKRVYAGMSKNEAGRLAAEWLEGAKTAGEYIGRALSLLIAARYADQGCLPQSAWTSPGLPRMAEDYGHGDTSKTVKAFAFDAELAKFSKQYVPRALLARNPPSRKPVDALIARNQDLAAKAGLSPRP
jgi:ParB/RepB/Spo0J family partition protein